MVVASDARRGSSRDVWGGAVAEVQSMDAVDGARGVRVSVEKRTAAKVWLVKE